LCDILLISLTSISATSTVIIISAPLKNDLAYPGVKICIHEVNHLSHIAGDPQAPNQNPRTQQNTSGRGDEYSRNN
jgi:hypothetical protein